MNYLSVKIFKSILFVGDFPELSKARTYILESCCHWHDGIGEISSTTSRSLNNRFFVEKLSNIFVDLFQRFICVDQKRCFQSQFVESWDCFVVVVSHQQRSFMSRDRRGLRQRFAMLCYNIGRFKPANLIKLKSF